MLTSLAWTVPDIATKPFTQSQDGETQNLQVGFEIRSFEGNRFPDIIRNHVHFSGGASPHLLAGDLEPVEIETCRNQYGQNNKFFPDGILDDRMICAGGNSDSCYVSFFRYCFHFLFVGNWSTNHHSGWSIGVFWT